MIASLDSATPPTAAQVAAAKAAGIGMWAGYVSEIPQRDGLYRPWTPAEFDVVRAINRHPIAYTSGWDDPVAGSGRTRILSSASPSIATGSMMYLEVT